MSPENPADDMPSVEAEACDLGGCAEPWAAEVERQHGPRKLRLCEGHATRWLRAEAELEAELEQMRGRGEASFAPLFGLARTSDGRSKRSA